MQTLAASEKIELRDVYSASRWLRDYELGIHFARDRQLIGTGSGSPDGIPIAIVDASTRNHEACNAVGRIGTEVLISVVHDCCTLSSLAAALYPHRTGGEVREVAGIVMLVLAHLTEHYAEVDARKKSERKPSHDKAPYHDHVPGKREYHHAPEPTAP